MPTSPSCLQPSCPHCPLIHQYSYTASTHLFLRPTFFCLVWSVVAKSFATLWIVAHQAPLSMEFPRQEYWCGLPFPSPGDLPDPGIELASSTLAGGFCTTEPPGTPHFFCLVNVYLSPRFQLLCYFQGDSSLTTPPTHLSKITLLVIYAKIILHFPLP